MMGLKVKRLREMLENALSQLEDYDDNDEVDTEPNTYRLTNFIGTYYGFINLDEYINIVEKDEEE